MESIIKITDTSVNVAEIMDDITKKAAKLSKDDVKNDNELVSSLPFSATGAVSPNILNKLRVPKSVRTNRLSSFKNKVLVKMYYIIWNTLHELLVHQQAFNQFVHNKIEDLENNNFGKSRDLKFNYLEFENQMRGPQEEIAQRQGRYLEFIKKGEKVLDLGCGRGEFIKVLLGQGIDAEGVDLNRDMVDTCRAAGLKVYNDDLLNYLENTEKKYDVIFLAHVVEHLPYKLIIHLVEEAFGHLNQGGRLIMETPNPTCLSAHMNSFYMDPTHITFVHPLTLHFICEQTGFNKVETTYLSPSPVSLQLDDVKDEATKQHLLRINHLLYGPQEYSLMAIKK